MDLMSARYGVPPSFFLDMPVEKFQFNLLVLGTGMTAEAKRIKEGSKRSGAKRGNVITKD